MILNINETKGFLKVDSDEDDNYIQLLIGVSEEDLKNTTGKQFDDTNHLAKLYCLIIISDLYSNRSLTIDKVSEKVRYTLQSIIIQLSYCYGGDVV